MLLIATNASAQHFGKKYRKENFTEVMGWGVAGGGALLTIGVAVTPMEYRRKQPVGWEPTPYWNQTAQMAALTTGITLTGTGLITALVSRKPKRRR